ncbi:uncharacterized protein PFLUO_LOCUS9383 [Penicillium psychrofluorescens]|uniref:uncharacterized protein n=1 Tax=Penicillium psychrofluorescens TaxID=3158075 RepID=UPI003CCDAEAF
MFQPVDSSLDQRQHHAYQRHLQPARVAQQRAEERQRDEMGARARELCCLALLELQGTINLPTFPDSNPDSNPDSDSHDDDSSSSSFETPVGKLIFPDYTTHTAPEDTQWMKRAYLYVGRYQRMTGEVKKLPRPIAVVQKRTGTGVDQEELEVVEVVRFKIVFQSRPEPVNDV